MAWRIKGREYESCSCMANCRCVLGPTKPDQEWCSAALVYVIESGQSEGVKLGGATVALLGDLPGDFLGGIDKARLVFGDTTNDKQRAQLEQIFQGKKGGVFIGFAQAIRQWLPSLTESITVKDGDAPSIQIGKLGSITLQMIKTEDGKQAVLENAPIAAALGQPRIELANGQGSSMAAPEMRAWESLGYGGATSFDLKG